MPLSRFSAFFDSGLGDPGREPGLQQIRMFSSQETRNKLRFAEELQFADV